MKFEFVPWTSFADRFLNELNSKGKLCDLLIGDSQWIGSAATEGHYVKLNEFFDKNGIKMSDFLPATVLGYSEWPKDQNHLHVAVGDTMVVTLGDPESGLAPGDHVEVEMVAPLFFDARGDRLHVQAERSGVE